VAGKLDTKMSETANSLHGDQITAAQAGVANSVVGRDPCAKKRSGIYGGEFVGNGNDPARLTVQKGLPLLNDGGSIILTGSVASVKGTPAFGVYAASKAAIRSFVRTWTTDLKGRHIRSNVVSPGPINTALTNRQSADVIARIVSTVPMGRMGEPDEVAKAALYLASDDSSFVTGVELFVDGGRAQI
jgi:NAD(P)-dependent dehydrogenase (short-subunit alcohol dehydrogenase family)